MAEPVPSRAAAISMRDVDGGRELRLGGELVLDEAPALWTEVRKATADLRKGQLVRVDVSEVAAMDGGTMALLVHIRGELIKRGVHTEFVGADENLQRLITLYRGRARPGREKRRRPESVLAQIGRATLGVVAEIKEVLGFTGGVMLGAIGVAEEPRTGNWREVYPTMERMGVNALPIVVLINFLVGFVLAYQAAAQLQQFGANIFVADLVGLSVTREMGPLMTAIVLCGRTGAAYAAELGSMTVAEEIDALRSMGFGPIRYLVFPRLIALLVAMPILTLVADFVGVLGGMVVAVNSLDLTPAAFLIEIQKAVSLWDVFSGVLKSVAFAIAIALISCQQGLATTGGAEGVGRRTTASVVAILLSLIVIDAGFTMFFHAFDL